jgi:tRNA pseudouridine38-40 synthase
VQPNGPSVQAEVERALSALHEAPRRVIAAGRTDSGVHARGQVCSFGEERLLPLAAYVKGTNASLLGEIAVPAASIEPDGFDARRSARGKRYVYAIDNVETRAPLTRLLAWQVFRALDVAARREAARPSSGATNSRRSRPPTTSRGHLQLLVDGTCSSARDRAIATLG